MRKKKVDLDVENLNEVITTSRKVLKVIYIVVILACVLLALLLFKRLNLGNIILGALGVASPFFIGFVIAWILNPAVTRLQKRNVKRGLGSVFVFVMFLLLIFIIIKVMVPMLYSQINEFIEIIPSLFSQLGDYVTNIFDKLSKTGFDFSTIETKIYESLSTFAADMTKELPTIVINSVSSVISSVWQVLLGLVVGFYLLIDFDDMHKIYNIVPKKYKKEVIKTMDQINDTCKNFVQGTLFISFIVFIITSIFFALIGLPSPMLFGLICGITNIIPYIGPWIGGAIATIVGFTVSPLVGILTIVIAFAAQQVDGIILQPLIMSKTMKLHPVTIMVGLLVFGYFFSVIGMIIATPTIAVLKILVVEFNNKYKLKNKLVNAEIKGD